MDKGQTMNASDHIPVILTFIIHTKKPVNQSSCSKQILQLSVGLFQWIESQQQCAGPRLKMHTQGMDV